MKSSKIRLDLKGFEAFYNDLKKVDGDINKAAEAAIKVSADIVQDEYKKEMKTAKVSKALIDRMPPPKITISGNLYTAEVGYEKGNYDPKNLSDGYKVAFINYGTPNRKKHGKIQARGFIAKAKIKSSRKVKKAQKELFEKILQGLKK